MKYLILYVYFETEDSKLNLEFFLKNGVVSIDDREFVFIIKGHKCSVVFPEQKNVKTIKMSNIAHDFGGWTMGLSNVDISQYSHFIFLNDTVRGPFIPRYLPKESWVKCFTSLLNDKVKLVGSTINYQSIKHVQSMAFSTDLQGLKILIDEKIFNIDNCAKMSKGHLIRYCEMEMSNVLIKRGYEIEGLQLSENKKIPTNDIHYVGKYFGSTINPIETMFIKTNRINDVNVKNYSKWNS